MFGFPIPDIIKLPITVTVVRDIVRKECDVDYGCGVMLAVVMIKMVVIGKVTDGCKSGEF